MERGSAESEGSSLWRGWGPPDLVLWGLVALGVLLRAVQYAGNAAFQIDEIALARNIAGRGSRALLNPLDYGQVAPWGFLLLQRLLWSAFRSDWSLRVIPFAASILALVGFRALARRTLPALGAALAVGAFAFGLPFIMYGAWVKQYSSDIAISVGLLLLAVRLVEARRDGVTPGWTGLAGVVAVWFSSSAAIVLAGSAMALGVLAVSGRLPHGRRVIGVVVIPWLVAATAGWAAASHTVPPLTLRYLQEYWAEGFPPGPLWTGRGLTWLLQRPSAVFGGEWQRMGGLHYPFPSAYGLLAIAGFAVFWRRRRAMAVLLLGPVLLTVGAAVAHRYPVEGRLTLFLTPVVLLAAAAAADAIASWLGSPAPAVGLAFLLVLAAPPLATIARDPPVYRFGESRTLVGWLAARRRPDDVLVVAARWVPELEWYGTSAGILRGRVVRASCWPADPRTLLREMDQARGSRRVWLVTARGSSPDEDLMRSYADSIGVRQDEAVQVRGGRTTVTLLEASRYDFSDGARLARWSAETLPVGVRARPAAATQACALGPLARRDSP